MDFVVCAKSSSSSSQQIFIRSSSAAVGFQMESLYTDPSLHVSAVQCCEARFCLHRRLFVCLSVTQNFMGGFNNVNIFYQYILLFSRCCHFTAYMTACDLEMTFKDQYSSHSLSLSEFLANSLYAIARPSDVCLSVVCNVRAPYSGGSNFRQYFYGIRYLGHPSHPLKISRRSSQGNPSAGGVKHKRGSQV